MDWLDSSVGCQKDLDDGKAEQAAYDALSNIGAPLAILARYQSYLAQPTAKRYQRWYEWYEQFE